ncbi:TPA: tryptophan synthase subunit alpha [Staphylococcus aureus]|nr:tryptophan synthase subunit alpha [Staphylococcus aureus]
MTKLFIPYIMGNKDLIENATLLSENGADIIEIGVPFSDPVADGPVIMEAGQQAIKQGIVIGSEIVKRFKSNTREEIIRYLQSIQQTLNN